MYCFLVGFWHTNGRVYGFRCKPLGAGALEGSASRRIDYAMENESHNTPPPLPEAARDFPPVLILILGGAAVIASKFVVGIVFGLAGLLLGGMLLKQSRNRAEFIGRSMVLCGVGLIASLYFAVTYIADIPDLYRALNENVLDDDSFSEWENVRAPDFTVTTLAGETVSLNGLRGKRTVLYFLDVRDPKCWQDIQYMANMVSNAGPDGVTVIGLGREKEEVLREFGVKRGVNFSMASVQDLPPPYGDVVRVPTTFYIDPDGVIREVRAGFHGRMAKELLAGKLDAPEVTPHAPPTLPPRALVEATPLLEPKKLWSATDSGAKLLRASDWDGDGTPEVVMSGDSHISVYNLKGELTVSLENKTGMLFEGFGHCEQGVRLLFSDGGDYAFVEDAAGKQLWSCPAGTEEARWGDLDGDGNDELAAQVFLGKDDDDQLYLFSADGDRLWRKSAYLLSDLNIAGALDGTCHVAVNCDLTSLREYDIAGHESDVPLPWKDDYDSIFVMDREANASVSYFALSETLRRYVVFDRTGNILWSMPKPDSNYLEYDAVTSGDVNRDGVGDWVFPGGDNTLIVASAKGERLAVFPIPGELDNYIMAGSILAVRQKDRITAYGFEPVPTAVAGAFVSQESVAH